MSLSITGPDGCPSATTTMWRWLRVSAERTTFAGIEARLGDELDTSTQYIITNIIIISIMVVIIIIQQQQQWLRWHLQPSDDNLQVIKWRSRPSHWVAANVIFTVYHHAIPAWSHKISYNLYHIGKQLRINQSINQTRQFLTRRNRCSACCSRDVQFCAWEWDNWDPMGMRVTTTRKIWEWESIPIAAIQCIIRDCVQ